MGTTQVNWQQLAGLTPRQREAIEATYSHRFVLYGGARGGGKSRLLRWWLLEYTLGQYAEYQHKGVHVALFCETYRDLVDRQISKIKAEFPAWMGAIKESKEEGLAFHLSKDLGSGVISLRNLDDPTKYQSAEWAAIGIDELTKISKETFDILRGSLRWAGISHTAFMGATNPGGIGHLWVKQLWVDRQFPPEMGAISEQFRFIQSLPADNPYLDQQYWQDLNSLPDDLRRAWVLGDWNVFAGQAFTTWTQAHVVQPFQIPSHWRTWRGLDWGYSAPMCCLWLARNPDNGRIYVYRELYARELTDRQQARTIADLSTGEATSLTYADPSMWGRKTSGETVTSTADEYAVCGVVLTQASNDRIDGKRKVDRLLLPLADGLPGVQVFSTCANLIRTLPALPYDKTRVEDIDTDAEDHAYDALRYGLTAITDHKPQTQQTQRTNPVFSSRMM